MSCNAKKQKMYDNVGRMFDMNSRKCFQYLFELFCMKRITNQKFDTKISEMVETNKEQFFTKEMSQLSSDKKSFWTTARLLLNEDRFWQFFFKWFIAVEREDVSFENCKKNLSNILTAKI